MALVVVTACRERMFGSRSISSPAPSNRASQIDCGATPLFNSSTIFSEASAADPLRSVANKSAVACESGFPSVQPGRILDASS